MPQQKLEKVFGKNGLTLWQRAQGIDLTPIKPYYERSSLSLERTFDKDTLDFNKLENVITAMAEGLAFQLRAGNKLTGCVSVKVRYADISIEQKQKRIPFSNGDHVLIDMAKRLLTDLFQKRQLIRLVGMKCTDLKAGGHQINLLEDSVELIQIYQKMDYLKKKYKDSRLVMRACTIDQKNLSVWDPWNGEPPTPGAHRHAEYNPQIQPMFLNCHSYFSLNYGTMSVEALLENAQTSGVLGISLTDINNTSGILDFLRLAPKYNIHATVGVDFRNDTKQLFVAIAMNNEGLREINEYLSFFRQQKKEIPILAPAFENVIVIYQWEKGNVFDLKENQYIGLKGKDIGRFRLYGKEAVSKLVILSPVSFRHKQDFNAHKLLRAIYYNIKGSQLTKEMHGNESDKFLPIETLTENYVEFDGIIENTTQLLERCQVSFEFGKPKNKLQFNATHAEDVKQLTSLAEEGLA